MLIIHNSVDTIQTAGTMEAADVLPAPERSAITVVGKRQGGAQPMSVKVTISFVALVFPSVFKAFIAFMLNGVAALPIPKMFAH